MDDPADLAFQPAAVVLGEFFRRHDHHGNRAPLRSLPQFAHEIEAVHARHHQVEQDECGDTGLEGFEAGLAVAGFAHGPAIALKVAAHQLAGGRIIFDDEGGGRSVAGAIAAEHGAEARPINRLGEIVCRAQREGEVRIVHQGRQDHRDAGQRGVGLERGKHGPTIHVGHHHIQRDDRGFEPGGHRQSSRAVFGGFHLKTRAGQRACHQFTRGGIVVNHQHEGLPIANGRLPIVRWGFEGGGDRHLHLHRQRGGERGAFARLAGDGQFAAHQPAELAADRQAQARAAILSRGGSVRLAEHFEQAPELFGGHADAGVGDGEVES